MRVSDDNRNNTIAGWVLGAGIAALGLSIVTGMAAKSHAPEKPGFAIVGEVEGPVDTGPPLEALLAAADLAKGEAIYAKCATCHSINAGGANGIGPNLHGVLGKAVAAKPGFKYSGSLKEMGGQWDFKSLDGWIASPRKMASGTTMSFAGLSNPEERANLLAWINTQGSNLPLPPVPQAAAPADGTAAPADAAAAPTPVPSTK
ncbi:MAG: c-type cytochrome [Sphingopyxis sp.]|nr:c-type cytochrome [Sphingopyxis sp.]